MLHANEFEYAGKKYKAVNVRDESAGMCDGCAFDPYPTIDGCIHTPFCTAGCRKDGRDVIWVEAENE